MSLLSRFSRRMTTVIASTASVTPAAAAKPASAADAVIRSHHAVVSVSGRDRPGIVNAVTTAVAEHGANVEDSRMALLGGDFALIAHIRAAEADAADRLALRLRQELPSFSVSVRSTTAPADSNHPDAQPVWQLSLEGPDHPGIVSALSEALATNGSNVQQLDTATSSAPFAGYELFTLSGTVSVDETRLNDLSAALDALEEKFGSTISLVKDPK